MMPTSNVVPNNAFTVLDFQSKELDTHNAVVGAGGGVQTPGAGSGWKFTAPVAGVYSVGAFVTWNIAASTPVTFTLQTFLWKNANVNYQLLSNNLDAGFTCLIQLNAGDYIQIIGLQQSGSSLATIPSSGYSQVFITQL